MIVSGEERSIVHMDLDSFFVSVECLREPSLKGKPVLIGGKGDRGVVASCSYKAREYGIHSAMPMKRARRLCPNAIILGGDTSQYSYYSNIVTDIIKEGVPVYEKTSIDEFYIDLTGMDRFFGSYKLASDLRRKITKETGLPISFGISKNKTVSKVATGEAKPDGQLKIDFGKEKGFLAPLSVRKIPMVGQKTYHTLRTMGVERVKTLQKMPLQLMEDVFGKSGHIMWKKANGIDNTQVVPYSERKSISSEQTFNTDTINTYKLKACLIAFTEKLAYKLRKEQKLTSCITVKVRYSDFDTHTMQARIAYTSCDHILIDKVLDIFQKLYNRRLLVRLIGVRFSHLVGGGYQINLFDDTEEQISLYQAMDKMKRRFGKNEKGRYMIERAVSLNIRNRDFNPFNGKASS